jgi:hypothetical protein
MSYSISDLGYGALTNYRNSFEDQNGQVGRFTRVAFELGYAGLIPLGALETLAWTVCAVVLEGVSFAACFIPLQSVDNFRGNVDTYFAQVTVSVINSATATTASALSLVSNLWNAGNVDAEAQRQAVKKCANKHLVNKMNAANNQFEIIAKPFSGVALRAITQWRNEFHDTRTNEVFTATKVFKQLAAVPLYLGAAALSALEMTVRTVYAVTVLCLFMPAWCSLIAAYGLDQIPYIHPIRPFAAPVEQHAEALFYHLLAEITRAGHALGTAGAALLGLKDNFMKNSDRVDESGQIDNRKQIDLVVDTVRKCLQGLGLTLAGIAFVIGGLSLKLIIEPLETLYKGLWRVGETILREVVSVIRATKNAVIAACQWVKTAIITAAYVLFTLIALPFVALAKAFWCVAMPTYRVGRAVLGVPYGVAKKLVKGVREIGAEVAMAYDEALKIAAPVAKAAKRCFGECFTPSTYY